MIQHDSLGASGRAVPACLMVFRRKILITCEIEDLFSDEAPRSDSAKQAEMFSLSSVPGRREGWPGHHTLPAARQCWQTGPPAHEGWSEVITVPGPGPPHSCAAPTAGGGGACPSPPSPGRCARGPFYTAPSAARFPGKGGALCWLSVRTHLPGPPDLLPGGAARDIGGHGVERTD